MKVDGYDGFCIDGGRHPTRPLCACGGKSKTYKFFIAAQEIGHLPIYAKAELIEGRSSFRILFFIETLRD